MSIEKINGLSELLEDALRYLKSNEDIPETQSHIYKLDNTRDKLKNRKYTVSVVAAMKAGKSTTFNALLGRDLLPNERAACTASITEIKHSQVQSDEILKIYYNGKIESIVACGDKSLEEMFHEDVRNSRKNDGVDAIEKYYVETPIKALEGTQYEDLIQNFVLIDTPGPNEASIGDFDTSILQQLALDQLRNSDALIMLLDYESYKSETNAKILKDIFEYRDSLKEDQAKVYFLLNKIDSMGHKDGTVEEVLENVKSLIKEYAPVLENPKVYGISGKQAMFSRCVLNETASEHMKKEMKDNYGSKYSEVKVIDGEEFTLVPKVESFAINLLESSNIKKIEREIISEVFERASDDMITTAENVIGKSFNEIIESINAQTAMLNKDSNELSTCIESSKAKLMDLRNKSDLVKSIPKEEFKNIDREILSVLNDLQPTIEKLIIQHLPSDDTISSTDRDSIAERIRLIKMNTVNAIQIYLNREVDKIQRVSTSAQQRLNNIINVEFNKLIKEATKDATEAINFTPRGFDINDTFDKLELSNSTNIESDVIQTGEYTKDSFAPGKATLGASGGAALGATIGSVVPIIGTVVGGAVGGLLGFFAGSKKKEKVKIEQQIFTVSISELKNEMLDLARNCVLESSDEVVKNLNEFKTGYVVLVEKALGEFIEEINVDFSILINNYEKEKGNKDQYIEKLTIAYNQLFEYVERYNNIC